MLCTCDGDVVQYRGKKCLSQIVIVNNEQDGRDGCPYCVLRRSTDQGREEKDGAAVSIVVIKGKNRLKHAATGKTIEMEKKA